MIKNVIFDVGRVLITWTPEETLKKLGCSHEEITLIKEKLFRPGIWDEEDRCVKSREELIDFFVSQLPELKEKITAFYDVATESARLAPYAHEWIKGLQARGYKVFILSNFGERAWNKAVSEGVIDFLDIADGYLVSYMVHKIKPEPEIFEELMKRYELNPAECVFIDDSPRNIAGAETLGIKGVLFEDYETAKAEVDRIIG